MECKLIKQFKEKGYSWLDWNEHSYLYDEVEYTNTDDELNLIETLSEKYGSDYEKGSHIFILSSNDTVKLYDDGQTFDI